MRAGRPAGEAHEAHISSEHKGKATVGYRPQLSPAAGRTTTTTTTIPAVAGHVPNLTTLVAPVKQKHR